MSEQTDSLQSQRSRVRARAVYLVQAHTSDFASTAQSAPDKDLIGPLVGLSKQVLGASTLTSGNLDACFLGSSNVLTGNAAAALANRLGIAPTITASSSNASGALAGIAALQQASQWIASGDGHLALVAAVDQRHDDKRQLSEKGQRWFGKWRRSGALARLLALRGFSPERFIEAGPEVLFREYDGLHAGKLIEKQAAGLGIDPAQLLELAERSRERAGLKQSPVMRSDMRNWDAPLYERRYGLLTAANSGALASGCGVCVLASGEALQHYGIEPALKLLDVTTDCLSPNESAIAMNSALAKLLQRRRWSSSSIDCWELDDFLGLPLLAVLDAGICANALRPDVDKVNCQGGSIAFGYAPAATGLRLLGALADNLKAHESGRGVMAMPDGFGTASAIAVETP